MSSFRVTFCENTDDRQEILAGSRYGVIPQNRAITARGRLEIRNHEGDIFRLAPGATFEIAETLEGVQPVVSGEVFSMTISSWHRYATSCHICNLHSSPPAWLLIRQSETQKNCDEYLLLQGKLIVHDYDQSGRHFTICELSDLTSIEIEHDPDLPVSPERYRVISRGFPMKSRDIVYIRDKYLDPQHWISPDPALGSASGSKSRRPKKPAV